MRGITPMLFLLATGAVAGFNATHPTEAVVFPNLEWIVPSVKGDLAAQGKLTFQILVGLTVLTAVLDLRARARAVRDEGR